MSRDYRSRGGRSRRVLPRPCAASERLENRLFLSAVNVVSYHNDAASTGQNLNEGILTPANVNSTTFGKLHATSVDGQVYAQPLYVSGVTTTSGVQPGTHNVAYVATEHDSLYAIDADTGTVLWQDSFLIPETALTGPGITVAVSTLNTTDVNSNDLSPEMGITSTPAIDTATGFLYLVANTKQIVNNDTSNPHYVYTLYKVNIQSGAFTGTVIGDTSYQVSSDTYTYNSGPSVAGSGDGTVDVNDTPTIIFNALRQLQRAAVTLYNGNVLLAFASHGDVFPYHGWILGYYESSLNPTVVFNANPNGDDCGIWQGGGKIAIDPQGFMYVETGNGLFDGTLNAQGFPINGDYGDTFLKLALDPTTTAANPTINGWGMKVVDYFTPQNQQSLNFSDTDLGSGGPLVLPATAGSVTIGSAIHPNLLVGAGKEGKIYLIDRDNMGRYSSSTDNVVQELAGIGGGGSYGTPSFFFDGVKTRIYYTGAGDIARTFTISNGVLATDTVSGDSYGSRQGTNSISADSTANGIVWNIAVSASQLRAYNASTLTQELWTSAQAAAGRDALGSAVKFTAPTVVNGHVYVGTGNALVMYGLLSPPVTAPTAPTNLTATAVSGVQINLSWQDNSNNESGFFIELSTDGGSSWSQVAIAGVAASSYSLTGLTPGTGYTLRVRAFNGAGNSAYTNTATATTISPTPALDFSSGFSNAATLLSLNGTAAKIIGSALQLTDAVANRTSSTFSNTAVSVTRFTTTFSFQMTSATAEGLTFTIQRGGSNSVGSGGSGLGYGSIGNSIALKFDIFSDSGEGTDSTGLFVNGATPSSGAASLDMTSSGLLLRNGNVVQVSLSYDGTTLQQTVTDTVTHATYSHSYAIDIPGTIGGSTAFVGFTASTGSSSSAIQNMLSWSYTPLPAPPATPGNLTVTPASGTELDLSWTQSTQPVDHFNILRLTAPNTYTLIAQVPGNVTTYPDGGLTPGVSYSYEVVASNAGGDSAPTAPVGNTTPTPPAGPTNLQFSNVTSTSATLTWTNNATNATGYKLVRQLASNNGQLVVTLPANATTYTDTGLEPDGPYQYILSAFNLAGPSTSANVSFRTLPLVINGSAGRDTLSLAKDADQLHIDWSMGSTSGQLLITSAAGLTFNGNGGADFVNLDYTRGNPLPRAVHLNGTFTINGITTANALSGTTIEIGQSTVYISYAGTSPASLIQHYLANGYNAGGWNGVAPGSDGAITSAAAAAGAVGALGVGYADSADGLVAGQPGNTVELCYTAMGDTNLDRVVNSIDAIQMARNYLIAGKSAWDLGNFNYDSTINYSDALLLQKNFNAVVTGSAAPATSSASTASTPIVLTTTAPVPTTPPPTTSNSPSTSLLPSVDPTDNRHHNEKDKRLTRKKR